MNTILVTSASGLLGNQLVSNLKNTHTIVKAAVRNLNRATTLKAKNVELVKLDFDDISTYAAALEGVDKVFLIVPLIPNQVEITKNIITIAKAKGVKKIVQLSGLGANIKSTSQILRWHAEKEKIVQKSGISYTILRPGNYMQNYVQGCYSHTICSAGKLMLPQGEAKINQVDVNDIAKASKAVLTNFGHKDKIYNLTGYSYTNKEIVDLISNITGKHITYEDISEIQARKMMGGCACNNADWKIDAMMELHQACKDGLMEAYSLDLKNLIGQGPTTFAEFALKNKSVFTTNC